MTNEMYLRVPSTAPGLRLDTDKKGLTFRKELIYANVDGEEFVKKTDEKEQRFSVDEERLQHWADTGNQMIANGLMVPTPVKHTDEPERNRGRIKRFELDINDNGRPALFGVVEFRDEEAAKLAASTDVSIFVPDKPVYDGFGNEYRQPIRHVCFTDYPVIPGLSPFQSIAASFELSKIPYVDEIKNMKLAHSRRIADSSSRAHIVSPKSGGGIMSGIRKLFGEVKSGVAGEFKEDGAAIKRILGNPRAKVAAHLDNTLKHVAERNVLHHRNAIKAAIKEEIHGVKTAIKTAPMRALKHIAHKPLGIATVLGTAGAGYLIRRALTSKPKDVAASLELSASRKPRTPTKRTIAPKSIVPNLPGSVGKATYVERKALRPKMQSIYDARRPKGNFAKHSTIATAALVGAAILHHLHKQAHQADQEAALSLSGEKLYDHEGHRINSIGRRINEKGQVIANPNSKNAQKNAQRETRARFHVANQAMNEQHIPSYQTAQQHGLTHINNSYHASKAALASPHNLIHAANHITSGLLHAGIVGAGAIHAFRHGKAAAGVARSMVRALTKHPTTLAAHTKLLKKHGLHTAAALGAAAIGHEGLDAHFEEAAQHIRAALSKRKK